MRTLARSAVVLTMVATLGLALGPAFAEQIIKDRGTTSQDDPLQRRVLKRDSGRRFLRAGWLLFTTNCEDPSYGVLGLKPAKARVDDAGAFHIERRGASPTPSMELSAIGFMIIGSTLIGVGWLRDPPARMRIGAATCVVPGCLPRCARSRRAGCV